MLIFVHSRKETYKTAKFLQEEAMRNDDLAKFMPQNAASREILQVGLVYLKRQTAGAGPSTCGQASRLGALKATSRHCSAYSAPCHAVTPLGAAAGSHRSPTVHCGPAVHCSDLDEVP